MTATDERRAAEDEPRRQATAASLPPSNAASRAGRRLGSLATGVDAPGRARVLPRTLRKDNWWVQPLVTTTVLVAFVGYSSWAAFVNRDYFVDPYNSPFYSPCLTTWCEGTHFPALFTGPQWISPAIYILIIPLGFRLTCYYYRKAYYRSIWLSPPACSVAEPHRGYTGETRFPLILQNLHRYFFYAGLLLNLVLTYDAIRAFFFEDGIGIGVGTVFLVVNATLLWLYSVSCHSCRHIVGGRLNHFSRHPVRYRAWTLVSRLNARHAQIAWVSLVFVALTDLYVRLVATGTVTDLRIVL